jgi:hypothetical protein
VQEDAGAVEDAGQAASGVAREAFGRGGNDRVIRRRIIAGQKCRALLVERRDDVRLDRIRAENGNEPRDARFVEDAVDGRGPAGLRR